MFQAEACLEKNRGLFLFYYVNPLQLLHQNLCNNPVTAHMFVPHEHDLSFTLHTQTCSVYPVVNPQMNSELLHMQFIVTKDGQVQPQRCGLKSDFCLS
jgi:hypothetical protein